MSSGKRGRREITINAPDEKPHPLDGVCQTVVSDNVWKCVCVCVCVRIMYTRVYGIYWCARPRVCVCVLWRCDGVDALRGKHFPSTRGGEFVGGNVTSLVEFFSLTSLGCLPSAIRWITQLIHTCNNNSPPSNAVQIHPYLSSRSNQSVGNVIAVPVVQTIIFKKIVYNYSCKVSKLAVRLLDTLSMLTSFFGRKIVNKFVFFYMQVIIKAMSSIAYFYVPPQGYLVSMQTFFFKRRVSMKVLNLSLNK